MLQYDEVKTIFNKVIDNLNEINSVIKDKENEYKEIKNKLENDKNGIEETINENVELADILEKCKIDFCKYKLAFYEIRNKYNDKIDQLISKKNFHFFLCFRKDYEKNQKNVIAAHQSVIDKTGYCWIAKFYKKYNDECKFEALEPFGESISLDGKSSMLKMLRDNIKKRIKNKKPLYLFFYNPNPPDIELYVCNVIKFFIANEERPIPSNEDSKTPECAHIPDYYFSKKPGNCQSCKESNLDKCKLAFQSNFWFKVDKIIKLENVSNEFLNLINCFTNDNINFAIPIFYPLIVTQQSKKEYFIDNVQLETNKSEIIFKFSERERGHTKVEKVQNFFSNLNMACDNCFKKVESGRCHKPHGPHPDLHKIDKNDEIIVCLPPEYRTDGSAMMFTVTLPENTSIWQKAKIVEKINDYINQLFRTNIGNYKFDPNFILN